MRNIIAREIRATARAAQEASQQLNTLKSRRPSGGSTSEEVMSMCNEIATERTALQRAEGKLIAFTQLFGRSAVVDEILADPNITIVPSVIVSTRKI